MKKHTKKHIMSIISVLLSVAMFVQCFPVFAVAQEADDTSVSELKDSVSTENIYGSGIDQLTDDLIVDELTDQREESVKYFKLTDGTIAAAMYEEPVHEKDTAGKWQDIDNSLSDSGEELENAKSNIRVKFSKNPKNGKLYTIKGENFQIKWALNDVNKNAKNAQKNSIKVENNKKKTSVKSDSETVIYEDLLENVDFQYKLTGKGVKENIILKDKSAAQQFSFDLKVSNVSVTLENNSLVFRNNGDEIIYTMSAPWMTDADGIYSNDITLSLTGSGNHYTVTLTPDMEWLSSAAYPVVVDPVLNKTLNYTQVDNTYVMSAKPDSSEAYEYGEVIVGRESTTYGNCRGVYKFDLPSEVKESDRVIKAYVDVTKFRYSANTDTDSVIVNAHKINKSLSLSSLTWNKLNGNYDSDIIESRIVKKTFTQSGTTYSYYDVRFDVTTAVRDWYRTGNNYGLALTSDNEGGDYKYISFYTARYPNLDNAAKPSVIIQFVNQNGVEDYLTYHTLGNDRMGTVSVGDFNGNMFYSIDDASTSGNFVPFTVSHYFDNSRREKTEYYTSTCYFGKGFRLNVFSRILTCSISGYPYRYLDEDGTYHYFKLKSGSTNEYENEFDANMTFTKYSSAQNGELYCMKMSETLNYYYNSSGFLVRIEDTVTGKSTRITYTSGLLTSIKDGAGHVISFEYTDKTLNSKTCKFLSAIVDPSGRRTTYSYDSAGHLTRIVKPGSRTISLSYNSDDSLIEVKDSNNSKICVEYNSTAVLAKVKTLTEYGTDGTQGAKYTFNYDVGQTTVTDDAHSKDDNYFFDDFGHTVNYRDNHNRSTFGKYNNTNDSNKNTLNFSTKLQSKLYNYLKNSDFEDDTTSPWNKYTAVVNATGSFSASTEQAYDGNKSMKIVCNDTVGQYGRQQDIDYDFKGGDTFTASAYVKVTNMNLTDSENSGVLLYFEYKTTDGDWIVERAKNYVKPGEWTRVTNTVTLPENVATASAFYVLIGFEDASGTAYFDNVQVEQGTVANRYNMLDNGHFRSSGQNPANWTLASNDSADGVTDNGEYKMVGNRTSYKSIQQVVTSKGNAGDKFTFNAWAKAFALSKSNVTDGRYRDFAIRIIIVNTDGTETKKYFDFESLTSRWQILAGEVTAEKSYSSVKIALLYNNQKNTAYFDNIQLFKEAGYNVEKHDSRGRLTQETSPGGLVTKYEYDGTSQRLKKVTYPDSTVDTYTYNDRHQLLTYTDSTGAVTTYHYDSNHNLVDTQTVSADGTVMNSGTTSYTSDGAYSNGSTDQFGNATTLNVNTTNGLLNSSTNAKNVTTLYTYDSNTFAVKSVTTDASKVAYEYTNDLLTSLGHNTVSSAADTTATNADVVYNFTYDVFGNRKTVSVGGSTLSTNEYNAKSGYLKKMTYGNGSYYVQPVYDSLDRVVAIRYNGVDKFTWKFSTYGHVGVFTDLVNNIVYRYEYDSDDRITRMVGTPGAGSDMPSIEYRCSYYHDSSTDSKRNGKVSSVTSIINGVSKTSSYDYDVYGRIKKSTFSNGTHIDYSYDGLSRANTDSLVNTQGDTLYTRNMQYASAGDSATLRVSQIQLAGTNWSDSYSYTYDELGNITAITKGGNEYASYEYDNLNQLTRENNAAGSFTAVYEYDNGGNILSKTKYAYTTGSLDGMTPTVVENYSYDNNSWKDQLTSVSGRGSVTYDEIGNPTSYFGKTMTWQNGRQLASVTDGNLSASYRYDNDSLRTYKNINGTEHTYIWQGGQIETELISYADGTTARLDYEYEAKGALALLHYVSGDVDEYYYYEVNIQGDVIGLFNSSGALVAHYEYDAWGNAISIVDADGNAITDANHIANLNPFRYRGYYYDAELGMYYLQSRYYDPELGRFINADGQILTGSDLLGTNLFAYCGSNPVMNVDPAGDEWKYNGVTYNYDGSITDFHRMEHGLSPLAYEQAIQREKAMFAATVYGEAAAYGTKSQTAVAHVINNRVGTKKVNGKGVRKTITDVVSEPAQFSCYENKWYMEAMTYYTTGEIENSYDKMILEECMNIVIQIYDDGATDVTGGCTYFYSPISIDPPGCHPSWVKGKTEVVVDGVDPNCFSFYK